MLSGFATPAGTQNFVNNHKTGNEKNFKKFQNLFLSNVGIGTYLGSPDARTDELVKNAVKKSVDAAINVIDTAINYRSQKAERSVGKAVLELVEEGKTNRNELFVSTKNGYVTNDSDINEDFWQYITRELVKPGIIGAGDISPGYHCMTVSYLENQLERSLKNLGFECVDLMYLHNAVEGQIQDISKEQFMKNLGDVFELYESKRKEEKIKFYGMATWECFRVQKDNPQYLSLKETLDLAKQAGGEEHGLRFIQLPYNMYLDQALLLKNQDVDSEVVSILEAAKRYKVGVFTSVPFMQGKLLEAGVLPEFDDLKPSLRALQFIRSTPGILAPLVGQKSDDHVRENLEIMKIPPLTEEKFSSLLKKLIS